jgi:hypothetical protein
MKKLLFVQITEKPSIEINDKELLVSIKSFDTEHNHIHENHSMKVLIEPSDNMQEVYQKIAKTLLEFKNNGGIDKVIFDTLVIYDRKGNVASTKNTYAEQVRVEFNKIN